MGRMPPYPAEFFRRSDEQADPLFYRQPRLVVHVDDAAVAAIAAYFARALTAGGRVLDLMSSWRSHMPASLQSRALYGVGLNAVEMRENSQLDSGIVHDINRNPGLPFRDGSFHAAVITVSIQYLTRPVDVFREVHRVLVPGGTFHVVYSDRMFPTKAVAVWQMLGDRQRADLIISYFVASGGWKAAGFVNASPTADGASDPVYVVAAQKSES